MKQRVLVTDFDGVLGDSLQIALALTRSIVQLFGDGREVSSFADYYKYFGRQSEDKIVTTEESQTLRELHRILIRYHFSEISLFHRSQKSITGFATNPQLFRRHMQMQLKRYWEISATALNLYTGTKVVIKRKS